MASIWSVVLRRWYHQAGRAFAHGISCTPGFSIFVKGNQSVIKSFESLTGQAKHNQMTELEHPGCQFGHGMILDILEYGIKAGERYSSICSYSPTENSANPEWLPMPWLQLEINKLKVESYPIARSTTQICIRLRPLSSSHTALQIWLSICNDDDLYLSR